MTERPQTHMEIELFSQPETWRRAAGLVDAIDDLPRWGERVAVIGCGTSWFMAQAYASLREGLGFGETDAFAASDAPLDRGYDSVVALTRSGTTTEVINAIERVRGRVRTVGVIGDADSPLATGVDAAIVLPFADEQSVVQTRFATTALALLRSSLGQDLAPAILDALDALDAPLDPSWVEADQITFLGSGWSVGLAHEAALKVREASQGWTESYNAMEYRHGPISIAASGRIVWHFGEAPSGLADDVAATGATFLTSDRDPAAELVLAQRVALARALRAGLNPDAPRNLTRSVQLSA